MELSEYFGDRGVLSMGELQNRKIMKLIGLVCASMIMLVGFKESYIMEPIKMGGMVSVAHRGASGYAPENTHAAFRKGLELGADFLEFDLHLSKDGELVIIHDDKVNRTTNGDGFVSDYTLAELKKLDAGSKFHKDFKEERISTLDELFSDFYGQIGLLIEIKKPSKYPGIEEKVAAVLEKYNDLSSVIVQSFDIESMRKMHELLPQLQVALLMKKSGNQLSSSKIEDLTSFATFINFNISYVNKNIIDQIHSYGGKVLVWSAKDVRSVNKAYQYGVDGIITDFSIWPLEDTIYIAQE